MSKLSNLKFAISDHEQSKQVQNTLFKLGYSWSCGDQYPKHTDQHFLYAYADGSLAYGGKRANFTNKSTHTEMRPDQFIKESIAKMTIEKIIAKRPQLQAGMRAETREGNRYVVMPFNNQLILARLNGWLGSAATVYDHKDSCCDTVFVYALPINPFEMLDPQAKGDILWSREQEEKEIATVNQQQNNIKVAEDAVKVAQEQLQLAMKALEQAKK